jgi:hypothetical protein
MVPHEAAAVAILEDGVGQFSVETLLTLVPFEPVKSEAPARSAGRCVVSSGERDDSAKSASRGGVAFVEVNRGAPQLAAHNDVGVAGTD